MSLSDVVVEVENEMDLVSRSEHVSAFNWVLCGHLVQLINFRQKIDGILAEG